jgi:hypothetical protein
VKRLAFSGYIEVADDCGRSEAIVRLGIAIKQFGQTVRPSSDSDAEQKISVVEGPLFLSVKIDASP